MKKLIKLFICLVLTLVVFSATFTRAAEGDYVDSVEAKEAPTIIEAILYDKDGNKTNLTNLEVTVTSVRVAYSTPQNQILYKSLIDAWTEVVTTKDIASLSGGAIKDKLNAAAGSEGRNNANAFVITDMFDLTYNQGLNEGETCEVTFELNTVAGENVVVMHLPDDGSSKGNWVVIDPSCVVVEDGKVKVTFDHLCPVGFLRIAPEKVADIDAAKRRTILWIIIIIIILILIALLILLANSKKKNANKDDENVTEVQGEQAPEEVPPSVEPAPIAPQAQVAAAAVVTPKAPKVVKKNVKKAPMRYRRAEIKYYSNN